MTVRTTLGCSVLALTLALAACGSTSDNGGPAPGHGGAGGFVGSSGGNASHSGAGGSFLAGAGTGAASGGAPASGGSAGTPSGSAGTGGGSAGGAGGSTSGGAAGVGGSTAHAGNSAGGAAGASSGGATGTGGSGGTGGTGNNKTLCVDKTAYAKCVATDFSKEDIFNNSKWVVSTWGNANRKHSVDNLWVKDGVLVMKVNGGTPKGQTTTGAEFASTEADFLYGSYRTMAKTASEPGTVNSPLFYYLSDTSEIDVEILSQDNPQRFINYTIHQNSLGNKTHQVYTAGFDPSAGFHEYRFDWTPQGVTYYIDGKSTGVTLTGNVPYQAGRLLVNHWTQSDPGWGGGPPVHDAFMYVKYIEIYHD